MAVYIITGKLGSGKTLVSVGLIQDKLNKGCPIATNVDLWVEHLQNWGNKESRIYRIPDKMRLEHLTAIGEVDNNYDEEKNGLVVLDEGGLMLNARNYKDAANMDFYTWGVHSRKKGWDLAILIQDYDALDKQIRQSLGEHVVRCIRWDRVNIPYVGFLLRIFGFKGTFGKMHQATCRYGSERNGMLSWRKLYQGKRLYNGFNTKQTYDENSEDGLFMYLTAWHVKGRHTRPLDEVKYFLNNIWREYATIKLGRVSVFFSALVLGGWANASWNAPNETKKPDEIKETQQLTVDQLVQQAIEAEKLKLKKANSKNSGTVETVEVIESDPWKTAYIGGYAGNVKTHQYTYKIKDQDGETLDLPEDATLVPISACSAIFKRQQLKLYLKCKT